MADRWRKRGARITAGTGAILEYLSFLSLVWDYVVQPAKPGILRGSFWPRMNVANLSPFRCGLRDVLRRMTSSKISESTPVKA
jgi:hypothetical protein